MCFLKGVGAELGGWGLPPSTLFVQDKVNIMAN